MKGTAIRRTAGNVVATILALSCHASAQQPTRDTAQRLQIGHFNARAILHCVDAGASAPIAILVPGTGGHGPEEAMPGVVTLDGQETELLSAFARGLRAAGFHTLQLGKPGIEFHTTWDMEKIPYDRDMFLGLKWSDLILNAEEAIAWVSAQRPCGTTTTVLVGHSEGTMRIADVAARNPRVRGLVFLGFHGRGFQELVDWQAYDRPIELFVKPNVDADHDGIVSRAEAARWPKDFAWDWEPGDSSVSIAEYAMKQRSNEQWKQLIANLSKSPLYGEGIWERKPTYEAVARLSIPILAFTGTLDVDTPPVEVEALSAACRQAGKTDCEIHLVPGLGHGFSAPRPPRAHPLLDKTMGPVDAGFLEFFTRTLTGWRSRVMP